MEKRFLGGVNEATIVLCNPNDQGVLLTVGQIKKVLRTKDGFFRKSDGYFRRYIRNFEYAKEVVYNNAQSTKAPHYRPRTSSDYFITSPNATIDILSRINYGQQIISGFHVTVQDVIHLEKLVDFRESLIDKKEMIESLIEQVFDNKDQLIKLGFTHPTVTNPDLDALKKFHDAWGVDDFNESHSKISEWYSKHKLRDYVSYKSVDNSDSNNNQDS